MTDSRTDALIEVLKKARNLAVLTGAGVSTLSGIPDFRSANGLYSQKYQGMNIEDVLSIDVFDQHPEYFYGLKYFVQADDAYQPNIVHRVLAKMEERGRLKTVYTQNIDRLHTIAGSRDVVELHGSATHSHCRKCNAHYGIQEILPTALRGEVPHCTRCGGVIKPDIVFYGEGLDEDNLKRAYHDFAHADLTLVLGTSLVVYPVAGLPELTLEHGGKLAIVNAQPTRLDRYAEVALPDLKSAFEAIDRWLDERS